LGLYRQSGGRLAAALLETVEQLMPVYSVEGKLGTGKTKFCVWMAQQGLLKKRRIASNVDIKPELLVPYNKHPTYIRLPDKPTAADLNALGHGNPDSYDEDKNGILILDELGSWLNSRAYQDPGRAGVIEWMIHARKLGWDVYLIVQDAGMIDKQVREALVEYACRCLRMDKVRIPFIGRILSLFYEKAGYFPKFHLVTARVGYGTGVMVADRWTFLGKHLHAAYDTRQVFTGGYPHGSHSVLPPWDYTPRELPWHRMKRFLFETAHTTPRLKLKPKPELLQWIQRLPPDRRIAFMRRHRLLT
jgi:hypothetical protein